MNVLSRSGLFFLSTSPTKNFDFHSALRCGSPVGRVLQFPVLFLASHRLLGSARGSRRADRRTCAPPTAENKNPPCPEYAPLHVACRTVRLQPLPSDAFGGKRCEHAAAVNAPEAEFLPMEIKVFSREGCLFVSDAPFMMLPT